MKSAFRSCFGICVLSWAALTASCQQLSYSPDPDAIKFEGIKSIVQTKEGNLILNWDTPPEDSRPVEKFEIFLKELAGDIDVPEQAALLLQDSNAVKIGIVVDMPQDLGPAAVGTVMGSVSGGTSFTVQGLSAGNYAFQVKAVDPFGARDENTKVLLYTIDEVVRFAGIESAEISGDKIILKWSPYVTAIKGEPIHYLVYEGITFADRERVGIVQADKTFFEIPLTDKIPGSTWTYGVRVKDPRGIIDNNISLKTIQVPEDKTEYFGCLSGSAKGASLISLEVEFPKGADKVNVYRNGRMVFTTTSAENRIFDDREGLSEGVKYTYKCEFERGQFKRVGSNILEISTLNSNPPTFAGIQNVTADGSSKAKVSWGVATGVPAQYFAVFVTPGPNVDWGADPVSTVEASKLSAVVDSLGDEIPYSFGVRACTAADVCDTNTVSILVTLPDGGPPKTVGASDAKVVDGKLHITAPWKHSDGAVLKRKVYVYVGNNDIKNFSKYTLRKTFVVNNLIQPEVNLVLDNLVEKSDYNIIVRDEGPSGNTNENMNVVSRNSGDLSAPTFTGIASLNLGNEGERETSLKVGFTAIAPEVLEPAGASHYVIYVKEGGGDACKQGVKHVEFAAATYTKGLDATYDLKGLKAKTVYSVCIKARDQAGNISATDSFLSKSTLDTTAPVFDGVQSLKFNLQTGKIEAGWNPSLSPDVYEYRVRIWLNTATPGDNEILTVTRPQAANKNGFNFDTSVFVFGSGDTVYVLADACDNAGSIPGGKQNCTSYAKTTAMSVTLADIEPPPGFGGIAGESLLLTPAEGVITVTWVAQEDKSDYAGFRVYSVDQNYNLEQIMQCACTKVCPPMGGCTTTCPDSCTVTGRDPYRTYLLHVRAYDEAGNVTQLDPISRSTAKRASDTTAPTFNSNLALDFSNGFSNLAWSAATDNQYKNEPGSIIEYLVYRKATSPFSAVLNPEVDGTLLVTTTYLDYKDNKSFESGVQYFYTVCARDASGNRKCDGNVKNIVTPDLVPPVISTFTSTKTTDAKKWDLAWTVTDNKPDPILIKVYKSISNDSAAMASELDSVVVANYNITGTVNLTGPVNRDVYVNYLLVAEDAAGNKAYSNLSVFSQNYIEVTAVQSNEGMTTGGKFIVLDGSGFHSSTVVKLGRGVDFQNCANIQRITRDLLVCNTPSYTAGLVDIIVSNEDGSTFTYKDAYTYCVAGSCSKICNNPGLWQTNFAKGNGLSSSPYVVCNSTHMNNVRSPFVANGRYVELGDNVDLKNFSSNDFLPIVTEPTDQSFRAFFDGKGHVVANFTYAAPPGTNQVGLFRYLYTGYDIRNVGVINSTVSGASQVGGIVGYCWSSTANMENVFFTGSVTGTGDEIGGVVGRGNCPQIGAFASATVTGRRYVGGIVGQKDQSGAMMSFNGTVTASGTVNTDCYVGGLVGRWNGNGQELIEVSADADVNCQTSPSRYTGGLFGYIGNVILKESSFTGTVKGFERTGGIVGEASATVAIIDVSSRAKFTATGPYVGGLVGVMYGYVKNSNYEGDIIATQAQIGGLIGHLNTTVGGIENSFANGNFASTNSDVGGLVGRMPQGLIKGSRSSGTVTASSVAGGLVGRHPNQFAAIESSYSNSDVSTVGDYAGGLVGYIENYAAITNSYATGNVQGNNYVGGAVGRCRASVNGSIQKSYAMGDVTGNNYVGGFCGILYDSYGGGPDIDVTESYATGNVTGNGNNIGGFVGRMENNTKIEKSYATGSVDGANETGGFLGYATQNNIYVLQSYATGTVVGDQNVGGFVGHFSSTRYSRISDSYATGKVTGDNNIGGFVGAADDMIERVYATGEVKRRITGVGAAGGLAGFYTNANTSYNGLGEVSASFWDTESTKMSTSFGGGTGRSSGDMKLQASYPGWDFSSTWMMPENKPPRLKWQSQ